MWYVQYSGQSKAFESKIQALLFAKHLRLQGYTTDVTFVERSAAR